MNEYKIAVLPGDGIGPEVTSQAVFVLEAAAKRYGFRLNFEYAQIGGEAIDSQGTSLPDDTLEICRASDAVILGAVGGPKWDIPGAKERPEQGLLRIRSELGLYANLRPVTLIKALSAASPLKEAVLAGGVDIMIVRELTGGIYFGKRGRSEDGGCVSAYDTEEYSEEEIRRIAHVAFQIARERSGKLCSVDKANVMESSRLWRETVTSLASEYPEVSLSHMYVDNAAMQLIRDPGQFDTILTSNMFGDILSDEASQLTGSIGVLPSASLGENAFGLYEPIHGSSPDLTGRGVANPIAAILSAAMLLRHSLGQDEASRCIEAAVERTIESGIRTADIYGEGRAVGTKEAGDAIARLVLVPD